MTRLEKYKEYIITFPEEIHKGISFNQVLNETRDLIKKNEGSLDGLAVKTLFSRWLLIQGEYEELNLLIKSLKLTDDPFVDYLILEALSNYYQGINDPSIDLSKAEEYYNKAEIKAEEIEFQDNFERGIFSIVKYNKMLFMLKNESEIANSLEKMLESLENFPELGNYKFISYTNIGHHYRRIGKIDLAIDVHKKAMEFFNKSDVSILNAINLTLDYFIKNELTKSKEYLSIAYEKYEKSTNYWLKSLVLLNEARILEHELKFDDLERNFVKHIDLANKYKNFLKIFEVNLELFKFYLNRFKNTNNKDYLLKAREIKDLLDEIAFKNKENVVIDRLNSYANAMLLRLGTLRQKIKAVEIYENLIKLYPQDSRFKLDLIEIYWDDLEYDIDGGSKIQIDKMIHELQNIVELNQNNFDNLNISFHIILAKYNFYINGNTKEVLESLYSLQSNAQICGYKLTEERLSKEIGMLEKDSKWITVDSEIKERMKKANLKSYIERAQMLLNTDL